MINDRVTFCKFDSFTSLTLLSLFYTDSKGNMLNGQMQKVRERIPTPESDNRLNGQQSLNHATNPFSNIQSIATGVALTAQNLASNSSIFPSSNNMPIMGTLLLSPINEADSVSNTLTSSSLAQNKSLLPFNVKSNTQFGSLVIPSSSGHDHESSNSNSFVVIPTSMTENEIIPVSITSVPVSITTTNHSTSSGAIITELPLDHVDSSHLRSTPTTPRLSHLFGSDSPASEHRVHRQQSMESNQSAATPDNSSSASSNSNNATTTTKRTAGGKKHSEVYV